ncbi:MAG: S8 family serine peptidase [Patescibacteria group bacterium]
MIKVDPNENIDNLIENFENNPEIEYAQPNYIYQLDFQDPNDTRFNQLW